MSKADYEPAGDQPQAIAKLIEGFEAGLAHQTLLGVTGRGKTYTIANVIQRCSARRWCMAHNKTLAAQLYGEFRSSSRTTRSSTSSRYYDYYQPEAYVPSIDTYIEKDASINEHIEQMRLSATKALLERRDAIIVATVSAIYGLGDPAGVPRDGAAPGRAASASTSASCCAAWPRCSTRATRLDLHARHLPRARRRHRHLPGGVGARGDARRAVRRRDRDADAVRSADRRDHRARCRATRSIPESHYVTPRERLLGAIDADPATSCASGSK